jgi:plasmid rolling circle replication initiator protein Rep
MWGRSLRVDYTPIVHIQTIKPRKSNIQPDNLDQDDSGIVKGICETMKYTVKEQDLLGLFSKDDDNNSMWLKQITEQLYLLRRIEYSGILKEFGKEVKEEENDNENLIKGGEEKSNDEKVERELIFSYKAAIKKYVLSNY